MKILVLQGAEVDLGLVLELKDEKYDSDNNGCNGSAPMHFISEVRNLPAMIDLPSRTPNNGKCRHGVPLGAEKLPVLPDLDYTSVGMSRYLSRYPPS